MTRLSTRLAGLLRLLIAVGALRVLLRGELSAEQAAARHYAELRRRQAECTDPTRVSLWDWPAFVRPIGE